MTSNNRDRDRTDTGHDERGRNEPGHSERGRNDPQYNEQGRNDPQYNEQGRNDPQYNEQGRNDPQYSEQGRNDPQYNDRRRNDPGYGQGAPREQTGTGLDENVAGALCYLFGFITGVIFLVIEDENRFVRFHAAQSIVTFGLVAVASIVLSIISTMLTAVIFSGAGAFGMFGIVSLFISLGWMVVSLASLGLWLFLMFQAYQGNTFRVPIAANFADSLV